MTKFEGFLKVLTFHDANDFPKVAVSREVNGTVVTLGIGRASSSYSEHRLYLSRMDAASLAAVLLEASSPVEPATPVLSKEQADAVEAEMRRLEGDPAVGKRALRLFMQHPMPCGHAAGNLLTCDEPPFGCVICGGSEQATQAGDQ